VLFSNQNCDEAPNPAQAPPRRTSPRGGVEPRRIAAARARPEFLKQVEDEIPFLRRMVRRWHRERPDAEDLIQDTLVRALANAHLWQPGSNLRAWLCTIMRNEFLAAVIKNNRSASALQAIAVAEPGPPADTREARLILRDVAGVLGRLPEKQRSAVFLVGIEGRSYEEVARSMGISVGAVRCDLARARDRLRNAVHRVDERSPLARRPTRIPIPAARQVLSSMSSALALAGAD
jgi:RNA polymerase sigma-70 factor, ECF subfamily